MTGSASDPPDWQPHIRTEPRREALADRFRDAADPLRVVLVRDMWLTGFDAPSLHTMYVDKPMRGHGLMQAIARVNRVFRDKPGGLVVDYLGLAHELRAALATDTESGGSGRTALDQEEAIALMLEKSEVCCALFHGLNRTKWTTGSPRDGSRRCPPRRARPRALPVLLLQLRLQRTGHVHVRRERAVCKFWLEPVSLAENHESSHRELNVIRAYIEEHLGRITEAWDEHGG